MIDEGQTDWKIIAIDNTDPMARKLSDISDIDVYMPGLIKTTLDWFRLYKVRCFFDSSLLCGSCHLNRASNDKFSVKFCVFVLIFFQLTLK